MLSYDMNVSNFIAGAGVVLLLAAPGLDCSPINFRNDSLDCLNNSVVFE